MDNPGWHTTIIVYAEQLGLWAVAVMACFLLSFLLQGFFGRRMGSAGKYVSLGLSLVATVLSAVMLFNLENWQAVEVLPGINSQLKFSWVATGSFQLNAGILVNGVSALMLALVTFITFLVHWYSLEYMKDDPRLPRYWAFLGLFALAMCGVVLADNLFVLFIFWELVGFSSYLLIGFWFEKRVAGPASQKAFLVNRIGDLGFVIALMLMFAQGMPLGLQEGASANGWTVYPPLSALETFDTTWIGFFLLIGVMGKSAQFPLQVWLPDAMAGPTPVSSLLHAATMVAAGVYLLVRTEFLFTDAILELMAWVGALTALIAAISALTQNDIKGVLAYSTISQLGFMVMAIGVGASYYGYYHLITHAFFKCGLFLAAGAVIHALHHAEHAADAKNFDAQDIRQMGGLARKMPFTVGTYLVFAASLAGLPLFSGFYSKDGILMQALETGVEGGGLAWGPAIFALAASAMTAFYIARHGLLIFFGKSRGPATILEKVKPANWTMRIPLILLALGSLALINFVLKGVFESDAIKALSHPDHANLPETGILILFVALALLGIGIAVIMWRQGLLGRDRDSLPHKLSRNHFFLDSFYEKGIAQPVLKFADLLGKFDKRVVDGAINGIANAVVRKEHPRTLSGISAWFDAKIIDGIVNRVAGTVMAFGQGLRKLQGGNLQRYLLYALIGLLLLLGALIYFA